VGADAFVVRCFCRILLSLEQNQFDVHVAMSMGYVVLRGLCSFSNGYNALICDVCFNVLCWNGMDTFIESFDDDLN